MTVVKTNMKKLLVFPLVAILSGCASVSKEVTSKLNFTVPTPNGPKTVQIVSPKDVSFDSVTVNPETGLVEVRGYKSVANAGAVAAAASQAQAQAQMSSDMLATVKLFAEGYAKSQGIPVPAAKKYD